MVSYSPSHRVIEYQVKLNPIRFYVLWIFCTTKPQQSATRNLSGDEIPERDIALFCYLLLRLTQDHRKILHGGQTIAKVQNGEEILPKVSTR